MPIISMKNVVIVGVDAKDQSYRLDQDGSPVIKEAFYFDDDVDDMLISAAKSYEKLLEKFDRKIRKHLVWIDNSCVGIC
ncbi:MAG: hypothetical protein IJI14_15785 [Anaerolineaceae bacterium]|nr:hypothetical protein [Anaerolineaceae bacterium]